ncbi:MAG: tetratricopeptide repeat protein [Clostridia bacterium]|nr:tetratricopeptide repeat protein [Clostridia bacterium]
MTRIQQSKLFITVVVVASVVFVGVSFYYLGLVKSLLGILLIQAFIIFNNRKQKKNMQTFMVARKLYDKGRYEEAITMFLKYLKEVKEEPDKEKTTLLNFGMYTQSSVAMSYNNIGASCIEMGYFQKAVESLERAIEVDSDYAIPYYNLAIIAMIRGEDELVNRYMSKLDALGYAATIDQITQKIELLPEEVIE